MADPFSIAVSAISLAAVLKEVVDIAQNLDDSFRKISRNKRSKDRISAFTLDSLIKLEEFYRRHAHVLDDARELREALTDLKRETEYVHERATSFITVPSKGILRRVKPIFNAWMNRDKVEAELMQLNRHIQDCHMKFSTFAVLRIDVTSHRILASTTRLETSNATMEQQLLVLNDTIHVGVSQQRSLRESITTSTLVTTKGQNSIIIPAARTAEPADLLSQVSEYVLAEMYLRSKVGTIDRALTELTRTQIFPVEQPIEIYTRPFAIHIAVLPSNCAGYQDTVIARALSISEVLQKHHISLSVQEGAWDMLGLSFELSQLNFVDEALIISRWTAELLRTMVNAGPTVYQPYFCLALLYLAADQSTVGDIHEAASTISACIELGRQQCILFGTPAVKELLACALIRSASISQQVGDCEKAFNNASEAIIILENILKDVSDWNGLDALSPLSARFMESCDIENSENESQTISIATTSAYQTRIGGTHSYLYNYGRALHLLSWAHQSHDRFREAAEVEIRALKIFQGLCSTYPEICLSRLAAINLHLSCSEFRGIIDLENAATYAQQATDLYRNLCDQHPNSTVNSNYYDALQAHGEILVQQQEYGKALEVSQEMARVAKERMNNQRMLADALREISSNLQRLERRDEAFSVQIQSVSTYRVVFKATSKHEGEAVYLLSEELHTAGWYQEAIEAAREAVLQYRILALEGGSEEVKGLANALSWLAVCFDSAKDYTQASHKRHEALQLLEDCNFTNPTILTSYLSTLGNDIRAAYESNDEDRSLPRSRDCIEKYIQLHASYPEQTTADLLRAFGIHRFKLIKHNHTFAVLKWIEEEVLPWFRAQPTPMLAQLLEAYMSIQLTFGAALMRAGRMHKALEITVESIELWKSQPAKHDTEHLHLTFFNRTWILLSLGRYEEALDSVHEPLTRGRAELTMKVELLSSLASAADAMPHVGMHEEALAFAEEAVEIYQKAQDLTPKYWGLSCLRGLAGGLADTGNERKALGIAREVYQMAVEEKVSETLWGNFHEIFGPCHFILAVCLFATGDLESGLHHLQELVVAQKEDIKARPGCYPLYANALHTIGWCYCALGRHEEGVQACSEFGSVLGRLRVINPEVAELVRVALAAEVKRPSRIKLWKKIDLQCGHQRFECIFS